CSLLFVSKAPTPPHLYPLSLHDALPSSTTMPAPWPNRSGRIAYLRAPRSTSSPAAASSGEPPLRSIASSARNACRTCGRSSRSRSEEHTSELQSRFDLVCRLLLEKKNNS